MKITLAYLLLTILSSVFALDLNLPLSSELNASSGLCLIAKSPLSGLSNPNLQRPGLASSISRLYSLPDLTIFSGAAIYKVGNFSIGAGGRSLNHPLWQDYKVTGIISWQYHLLNLGIAANYLYTQAEPYCEGKTVTYDIAVATLDSTFSISFLVKNITQIRSLGEELPIFLIGEYSYNLNGYLNLGFGFEKQKNYDFSIKLGNCCTITKYLSLIASYQFQPDRIGAGVFIKLKKFELGVSIRTHRYLDFTEAISLNYEIP